MIQNILLSLLLGSTLVYADTIEFKNGASLKGKVTAQTKTTLSIDLDGTVKTYAQSDIKNIQLDPTISAPPAPISAPPATLSSDVTIDAGTVFYVKTSSPVDTAHHKKGHQFKMFLDNDLVAKSGAVIAPKGSMVYALVVDSQQAGRLVGESKMIVSLTGIEINSKRIDIHTESINILAPQKQGRDTAKKMVRGAAIGALFNGHDGARDGAKVGLGAAILTRGKATGIPAGTLLNFTLNANVYIKG